MAKTLFISTDYIKKNSPVNFNIEDKLLTPVIAVEQDINFEKLLGTKLYNSLQTQAAAGSLTADNQILLEEYVQQSLLYFVLSRLIHQSSFKFHQKGVGVMESENEKPLDFEQIKYYVKDFKNIGEYYAQRLINYLKANSSNYQDYASPDSGWDQIQPNHSTRYFHGWYFPRIIDDCDNLANLPSQGQDHYYIYRGDIEP